jgi:hypothetical protein
MVDGSTFLAFEEAWWLHKKGSFYTGDGIGSFEKSRNLFKYSCFFIHTIPL